MGEGEILDLARDALEVTLLVAGPVLAVGLVVGVVVSFLQALTQIQEATLAFVPKILAIFGAILLLGPFMLATLTRFMQGIADRIVGLS